MTAFTTQTLVANVVYGVPSGNYPGNSQTWFSNSVPAASYYAGQGSIQTVTYQLNNFVGLIKIEATLNDQQASAPWFEIANIGNISNATSGTSSTTVIGNFSWLRAEIIDYTAGNIQSITAAY
jgi:hypothetical protein